MEQVVGKITLPLLPSLQRHTTSMHSSLSTSCNHRLLGCAGDSFYELHAKSIAPTNSPYPIFTEQGKKAAKCGVARKEEIIVFV
jgi:hypothetical protein